KVLEGVAAVLEERERARTHQHMLDIGHECVRKLSDGTICAEAVKVGARHSAETMAQLKAAHRHLVAAGARCNAAHASESIASAEHPSTEFEPRNGVSPVDLGKALAGERAEKAELANSLAEIVPMLERLRRRLDDIAQT